MPVGPLPTTARPPPACQDHSRTSRLSISSSPEPEGGRWVIRHLHLPSTDSAETGLDKRPDVAHRSLLLTARSPVPAEKSAASPLDSEAVNEQCDDRANDRAKQTGRLEESVLGLLVK